MNSDIPLDYDCESCENKCCIPTENSKFLQLGQTKAGAL